MDNVRSELFPNGMAIEAFFMGNVEIGPKVKMIPGDKLEEMVHNNRRDENGNLKKDLRKLGPENTHSITKSSKERVRRNSRNLRVILRRVDEKDSNNASEQKKVRRESNAKKRRDSGVAEGEEVEHKRRRLSKSLNSLKETPNDKSKGNKENIALYEKKDSQKKSQIVERKSARRIQYRPKSYSQLSDINDGVYDSVTELNSTCRFFRRVDYDSDNDESWREPSRKKQNNARTKTSSGHQKKSRKSKKDASMELSNDTVQKTNKSRKSTQEESGKLSDDAVLKPRNARRGTKKDKEVSQKESCAKAKKIKVIPLNNAEKDKEKNQKKIGIKTKKAKEPPLKKNISSRGRKKKEVEEKKCAKTDGVGESGQKEALQRPEDCPITAKRGSLKYYQQREMFINAVAKETECDDDFFSCKDFSKNIKIGKLLAMQPDDTLTIKTPQGKGKSRNDNVMTPRTELLGAWNNGADNGIPTTPSTGLSVDVSSPAESGRLETIYHHFKNTKQGRRKKKGSKGDAACESLLLQPIKSNIVELPEVPDNITGGKDDSSDEDDYFDTSDAY